jgi:hypothetical protein
MRGVIDLKQGDRNALPGGDSFVSIVSVMVCPGQLVPGMRSLPNLDHDQATAGNFGRITMLLCFVKLLGDIYLRHFKGAAQEGEFRACAAADKTGRGRSRWRASSYEVTISRPGSPGTAGGSLAGQQDAAAE